MVYRNYYISFIVRIVILVATCLLFAFMFYQDMKVYTTFLLFLIIVIQSILLIRFANRLNKEFYHFLELVKDKDTKYKFLSKSFASSQISQLLNEIAETLYISRTENEKKNLLIKFIIENVDMGLFVFTNEGKVLFYNQSVLTLLNIRFFKSIEDFNNVDFKLFSLIKSITSSNQHKQINIQYQNESKTLIVRNSLIKIEGEILNLVMMQDIKAELDEKEIESWQKVIRVLNHEIMNSITPISSLTYSIKRNLSETRNQGKLLDITEIDNTINDLDVIERRGNSLTKFVENYRRISKIELSKLKEVRIDLLIERSINLFKMELLENNIKYEVSFPSETVINADENLLEQAFINLIKNSIEALKGVDKPNLRISATREDNSMVLKFYDNGIGIPKEKIDDIFIPFYTTKENGSGIGLSLVKQIIRLHKGSISATSKLNEETVFTVKI